MTMQSTTGSGGIERGGFARHAIAVLAALAFTAGAILLYGGLTAVRTIAEAPGPKSPNLWISKFVEKAWIPLGTTANDLMPFVVMAVLLGAAAVLMRTLPRRQWARRVVQVVSGVAFVIGIHPCGCMTRDLILGTRVISADDLAAFKYMVVFVTVGAFTVVVGRGFCGWLCPLGFVQELMARVSRRFYACIAGGDVVGALWRAAVFFAGAALAYSVIVRLPDAGFARVYGGVFLATAAMIALAALLRSALLAKYLFGVGILVSIIYAFYRTKPGTYSIIAYTMVFFVLGLALIVLTVIGDDGKDRLFKKLRYGLWAAIIAIYVYNLYNVGPMCLFFQGSSEWPVLLSFGGVFLLSLLVAMSWCKYMCPEGAALGLLAAKAGWQINRSDKCRRCGTCMRVCPMHCIEWGIRDRRSCIYCCLCADCCPEGALEFVNEIGAAAQPVPAPLEDPATVGKRCTEARS